MFPFKTKEFSIQTELTVAQLRKRLATEVSKQKLFSINNDGQLYGTIGNNNAVVEIGQSFQRNSFRPVVVFKWTTIDSKTIINGYYRVDSAVLLWTLGIPCFGLYLAIQINNVLPLLFCALIWTFIYMTIGRWLFNKDFIWTEEMFLNLIRN